MPDRPTGARDGANLASSRPMKRLVSYFLRGLLITLPAVFTGWLCYEAFRRVDSWLGIDIPGVGFLVTLVLITLLGFLGSNLVTRGMVAAVESLIERLPFVRLVYTSTKDLLDAFVGQKKRFNKPVAVHLSDDGAIRVLGFVTQDSLAQLGLDGTIMVYVPFSYSLAGWTCLAPASRVKSLETSSADFMAFVVSGGVVDVPKLG